ncbi:hypothetical protein J4218_01450 [Candidatus Pacearchaeota archaeon]|nr:hypothetical protein [Candidatus Pacearchaeota archaeon]
MRIKKRYANSGYLIPIYSGNKKGIEMGFNWLFAIVAGGFILFLAIYAAGRLVNSGSIVGNTLNAKNFVNILETWEAGLAAGVKPPELQFRTDTNLYFGCSAELELPFGKQTVSASDIMFNDRTSEIGYSVAIRSKYIFTENQLRGKRFYPFSVGFFMPFHIADLIIFSDRDYCFYDAPAQLQNDLQQLQLNNVLFPNKTTACEGVRVCFSNNAECDIVVSTSGKYVIKEDVKMYYYGNLIYAAIFSSPEIYECNVKRLMNKLNQLGPIYLDKIEIIKRKNCESNVAPKLNQLITGAETLSSSADLAILAKVSEDIDSINEGADPGCKLYKNQEKNEY